jgi:hypothetical protein
MIDQEPMEGQSSEGHPPKSIRDILDKHQEAFIVVLDPDSDVEGESIIACFMKFEEKSRLSAYLHKLLQQLLQTSCGKPGNNISTPTAIGS